MDSMLRGLRLAASLGATLLTIGCSAVGVSGPGDGTFVGGPPDRFNFNDRNNWAPPAVPTGTATVPLGSSPPYPLINFSESTTSLDAVRLEGDLGLTVESKQFLKLKPTGQGLILCCKQAHAHINGELTGNVSIGDASGTVGNQLSGGGTINGSIQHRGGTLSPGSGPALPVMTVFGTYEQQPTAGLGVDVFAEGANRLEVRGAATLGGLLVIYVDDPTKIPIAPFKVLTAGHGRRGEFSQVRVERGTLKKIDYNPNDVTVTIGK